MPDTIITIGDYGFNNCTNLIDIEIPINITNNNIKIAGNIDKVLIEFVEIKENIIDKAKVMTNTVMNHLIFELFLFLLFLLLVFFTPVEEVLFFLSFEFELTSKLTILYKMLLKPNISIVSKHYRC